MVDNIRIKLAMYRDSEMYRRTLLINRKATQKRTAKENRKIKANRFFTLLTDFFISAHSVIKFNFVEQVSKLSRRIHNGRQGAQRCRLTS